MQGVNNGLLFLSIQAQDFIEETIVPPDYVTLQSKFLSIQAQDFIEEFDMQTLMLELAQFLSIQAQDFIEDKPYRHGNIHRHGIPEHSSSGLH